MKNTNYVANNVAIRSIVTINATLQFLDRQIQIGKNMIIFIKYHLLYIRFQRRHDFWKQIFYIYIYIYIGKVRGKYRIEFFFFWLLYSEIGF